MSWLQSKRVLILADREVDDIDPSNVELIISLGDLWGGHLRQFAELDVPKIGVYGNHCRPGYLERHGFLNAHCRVHDIFGIRFGGIEGCVRYKPGELPFLYSENEMAAHAEELSQVDVLLLHAPPAGLNDIPESNAHRGSVSVRSWVDANPPQSILHGHVYPEHPVIEHGTTQILWVYGAAFAELDARGRFENVRPATNGSYTPETGFENANLANSERAALMEGFLG